MKISGGLKIFSQSDYTKNNLSLNKNLKTDYGNYNFQNTLFSEISSLLSCYEGIIKKVQQRRDLKRRDLIGANSDIANKIKTLSDEIWEMMNIAKDYKINGTTPEFIAMKIAQGQNSADERTFLFERNPTMLRCADTRNMQRLDLELRLKAMDSEKCQQLVLDELTDKLTAINFGNIPGRSDITYAASLLLSAILQALKNQ